MNQNPSDPVADTPPEVRQELVRLRRIAEEQQAELSSLREKHDLALRMIKGYEALLNKTNPTIPTNP